MDRLVNINQRNYWEFPFNRLPCRKSPHDFSIPHVAAQPRRVNRDPRSSNEFLAEQGSQPVRLRLHSLAVVEEDGLREVLPPTVVVVDRSPELGLRLPGGCDARPVFRGPEDILRLRECDEREVEPSCLAVQRREVQERPAAALQGRPVVLPVEPLERVEEERFRPLRIVAARREDPCREERLGHDVGIAGGLGLVQPRVERGAGVVPSTELQEGVPVTQEREGAGGGVRGLLNEVGVEGRGLVPSEGPLLLKPVAERGGERVKIHGATSSPVVTGRALSLFARGPPQSRRATSSTAETIRSMSAGPTPGWMGSSKRPGITASATGHRPRSFRSRSAFCLYSGIGYEGRQPIQSSVRSSTISSRDRGDASSRRTTYW